MPFKLDEFRSNFIPSSPALFELSVSAPANVAGAYGNHMKYTCHTAQIPSRVLATVDRRPYGQVRKVAFDRVEEALTVSIRLSEGFPERTFLESWFDTIYNTERVAYYDSYIGNATLTKYSVDGTVEATYYFEEVYPTSLGQIEFDWDSTDNSYSFSVDFAFHQWERLDTFNNPNPDTSDQTQSAG